MSRIEIDEIDGSEDVLDSRDIVARFELLEEEHQDLLERLEASTEADPDCGIDGDNDEQQELDDWEDEYLPELEGLRSLIDDCDGYSDWKYGLSLINEDYFVEYCKDMLVDCGDLPRDIPWYIEIDWEKTADNLKTDYGQVELFGNTFYVRE